MEHALPFLEEKLCMKTSGMKKKIIYSQMKIKAVSMEIKFRWKMIKSKNQKQLICNKANVAFFNKKLKRYLTVLQSKQLSVKSPKYFIENPSYSPSLADYFLDNWTRLTPLWIAFVLKI